MHGSGRMPLKDLNSAFDGLYGPGDQWYWRGDFVQRDPRRGDRAEPGLERRMPTWKCGSHIYPIDGAAHDVAAEDTAFAYRDATWSQVFIGVDPDPASAPTLRDWAIGYWEALHPYSAGGAYVNFMMDEGQARVKATYGAELRPAVAGQGDVRPRQRVPREPEHRAGRGLRRGTTGAGRGPPPVDVRTRRRRRQCRPVGGSPEAA